MTTERASGLALIAGTAAMIVTMLFHPRGHDLFAPGQFEAGARQNVLTHALALCGLPLSFLGASGLTRRLTRAPSLALGGLVLYGFACVGVMIAAVASGLVATELAGEIVAAGGKANETQAALFHYNGFVNQAFAKLYVVASSLALFAWSFSILRGGELARALGIYGCVLAPVTLLALLSGHVQLDVHGFGAIVLGQAVWNSVAGALLCRARAA
ncbi:MAG: hypothetical protein EXS08_14915 [Planctomycetes bacterium]|nr:hypothetical protein [Planctomycetota bacterium]